MSILDALKVQKAERQSVRDLAMLPQQLIVQMAQRGDIPAEVFPVVINEKARMAEEKERMLALASQGQPNTTVLEKGMAVNARAENPQGIAQMSPPQAPQAPQAQGLPGVVNTPEVQATGVSGLPTGQMFSPQNFAGGGIVAFAGEGRSDVNLFDIVDQQQRQDPSFAGMFQPKEEPAPADMTGFRRRYASLADALKDVQSATGPMRQVSAEEIALQEYLTKSKPRTEAESAQSGWLRALEAGLGIMGGTSPYALTNIGKGAESAVKGFSEDVKERRKGELATLSAAAQQARQKRLEGIEDVKEARQLLEKDLEAEYRERVLSRPTDLDKTTKIYFDAAVARGADPKDPKTMEAARKRAYEDVGLAAARVGTQQFGIESQNRREASNYVESRLGKQANPEALKMRRLEQEDKKNGTETAAAYRDELFREAFGRISRGETLSGALKAGEPAPKPEAKAEPKAAPKGGAGLPETAKAQLKEGFVTKFSNGQEWTLRNGQPERVK